MSRMEKAMSVIKLLRMEQWVKNGFIFLPLFFGSKLLDIALLGNVIVTFFGFSLIASAVYIFNDWKDIEPDKAHPVKKHRPLASGKVEVRNAFIVGLVCFFAGSILLASLLNNVVFVLVAVYFLQNILYSLKLKHIAIADVMVIAVGFLIRVMIGGAVTGIVLSHWIIIMTFLIALFLAFAKRRDDVLLYLKTSEKPRKNIDGYDLDFLNAAIMITSSILIVAYIMYTTSPEITMRINHYVYGTAFFVIVGVLRYLQLIYVKEQSGDPAKVLLKDSFIQLQIAAWVITFFIMLYARKF